MSRSLTPFYCPFCADQDLHPSEADTSAWECRSCTRLFSLRPATTTPGPKARP